MFGYIKLDGYAPKRYKDYFKQNYCFLCRSLDKHYGFFSRLFVSFDVTFFTVLFSADNYLTPVKKISCFKKSKELSSKLSDDFSKKIAALNLALAAGELSDNINDKDKFYAKIAYFAYRKVFKKVKKDYPLLWDIVEKGHYEMSLVEKENGPIEEIEDCFAHMIDRISREVFMEKDESKISTIKYVAKMLYFMDAVDDIDKDIKRNTYNALKCYNSKREYTLVHYSHLNKHLQELRADLLPLNQKSLNAGVINRVLNFGIPETLVTVCFKGIDPELIR
jgi:hypothetical protein